MANEPGEFQGWPIRRQQLQARPQLYPSCGVQLDLSCAVRFSAVLSDFSARLTREGRKGGTKAGLVGRDGAWPGRQWSACSAGRDALGRALPSDIALSAGEGGGPKERPRSWNSAPGD